MFYIPEYSTECTPDFTQPIHIAHTSDIIKLTPPVDSYTIVLLVLTLSTTQGWF